MPRSFGPSLSRTSDFGGKSLSGGIGRRSGLNRGKPDPGGVFPSKGKGWGIQGETALPDILSHWDRVTRWQSWRRGMQLAFGSQVGQTVATDGLDVLVRPAFKPDRGFEYRSVALMRFASSSAPSGVWTTTIMPRGLNTAPLPLQAGMQRHETRIHASTGETLPVLVVDGGANWQTTLQATSGLVGELITDTATGLGSLAPAEDGISMLCLQVDPSHGQMVLDASRYWRYEITDAGRRVLVEHRVQPGEAPPQFRIGRHLCQALTISCNCPSHLGVEHARLRSGALGTQALFPQQGGQNVLDVGGKAGSDMAEGVKRRFAALQWARIPGEECKHCHATRFMLNAALPEPTDMLSPAADYWQQGAGFDQLEEIGNVFDDRAMAVMAQRSMLLRNAWDGLDQTLLASSVGDALTVMPTRVSHDPPLEEATAPMMELLMHQSFRLPGNPPRFNEMHFSVHYQEDDDAIRGDWWIGRGTNTEVRTYDAAHVVEPEPTMKPMARHTDLNEGLV